jgi:hypothetical protein
MYRQPLLAASCLALAGALTVPPAAAAAPMVEGTAVAATVPGKARAVDTSRPDRWVGTGTPRSCTSRAVVRAVAKGGVIRFRCGPHPVRIEMRRTAKVVNTSRRVVLDGGGLVTLSGGGKRRVLYQNTCDRRQTWTTSHCDDQATPRLVVQDLAFAAGNATGATYDGGGGGAIFARGGRLKIVRSTFVGNRCDRTGPDLGGGAVRALSQHHAQPVTVVRSTFRSGVCSNGGALSSIGVSWSIYNSVFTGNRAIGRGGQPRAAEHPRRRLGWRRVCRRQRLPHTHRRHEDGSQSRARGWRCCLLRQQRPNRRPQDPFLDLAGQPQRWLRNRPRHLLPRPRSNRCRLGRKVTQPHLRPARQAAAATVSL